MTEENLKHNNDGYDDLQKLCKHIKLLIKQGYEHDPDALPFDCTISRLIKGHYILINVISDTMYNAKENLYKEITNGQLVYTLHKSFGPNIELIGIVHVTKLHHKK